MTSARKLPRIGRVKDMRAKWSFRDRKGALRSQPSRPRCAACGQEADDRVDVEVSWFRGEDETKNACSAHKGDADALLRGMAEET